MDRWKETLNYIISKGRFIIVNSIISNFREKNSLCLLFFMNFLFFTKWYPFKNYEKCFLFHLKSSFRYRDIRIFIFPSSPLFLPVSHCFRGCSKINLKVYDIITCLNKNLLYHILFDILRRKKGITLKLCPLIEY